MGVDLKMEFEELFKYYFAAAIILGAAVAITLILVALKLVNLI